MGPRTVDQRRIFSVLVDESKTGATNVDCLRRQLCGVRSGAGPVEPGDLALRGAAQRCGPDRDILLARGGRRGRGCARRPGAGTGLRRPRPEGDWRLGMCGICGIFHREPAFGVDRDMLRRMNQRIAHRGPDDEGLYLEGNVGLAMRRLSIIDVRTGHQPIANEDESVWIVYNGELYNHLALRQDLEARGHRYRTKSDTETIIHLYEEHGRDCVKY